MTKGLREKISELKKRYPEPRAALIPTLQLVQKEKGFLSAETRKEVAELLEIPEAQVFEVVSFYTMFRTRPAGKYHLQLCQNLSCSMEGGEEILKHLKKKLGIGAGETTPDGLFTLSTVECLASCGTGPVVQVNEKYHEKMTKEKVDELISGLAGDSSRSLGPVPM